MEHGCEEIWTTSEQTHELTCDCSEHAIQENVRLYIEQEIRRSNRELHKQILTELKQAVEKIDIRLNQLNASLALLRSRR